MRRLFIMLTLLSLSTACAFIAKGTVTLTSAGGLNSIGFTFSTGNITGNNGDFYYFNDKLWTNYANAGIKNMGVLSLEGLKACDLIGYIQESGVTQGNTYCIKTIEGSYAKIQVTDKTSTSLTFTWMHQRDGTNSFTEEETEQVKQAFDINYALIGIIIVLTVIIVILWKFR